MVLGARYLPVVQSDDAVPFIEVRAAVVAVGAVAAAGPGGALMGKMSASIFKQRYGEATRFMARRRARGDYSTPWVRAFNNIKGRCENPETNLQYCYYGGRGIKCRITVAQLKLAFYRDRAFLMKQPSVDRINSKGHYTPKNTRWIEFAENRVRRNY